MIKSLFGKLVSHYFVCRKMMNRVSAQNARDRKKVYVDELERKIALLERKVSREHMYGHFRLAFILLVDLRFLVVFTE